MLAYPDIRLRKPNLRKIGESARRIRYLLGPTIFIPERSEIQAIFCENSEKKLELNHYVS